MLSKNRKHFTRNFLILIFILSFSNLLYSQVADTVKYNNDTSEKGLNISNIQDLTKDGFNFWQDKFSGHFAGIDLGFNALLNSNYTGYKTEELNFMDNDLGLSNSLFINIINQSIGLQHNRNTIGLVTGMGLQLQSYRLNKNTTIETSDYGLIIPKKLVFDENQKSKLSAMYIVIPLLVEFQLPIKHYANRLYFSTGLYSGIRLNSHTKIKYRLNGKKKKLKTPDSYFLNNLKYGIMTRVGYRWINLFATYDITTLFKQNSGPELTPFTFGVTLLRF